jgi:hypothetical protein
MTNKVRSKYLLTNISLVLFLSFVTVIRMGDFKVGLANSHDDDNPVTYSYFLENPEKYEGDIISTYGYLYGLGTIQNWLPAVLLKTTGLPPEIPALVFFYLQNVLLGFALLRYARKVTGRNDIALLTIFFAFAALPWRWNLANYFSIMNIPYIGDLVLPFLIFAAIDVIEGRFLRVIGLLTISGMIHSGLTLYMIMFIGIFWLSQYAFIDWQKLIVRMLSLGVVVAVCVVPPLLMQYSGSDRLSYSELMVEIRHSMHMYPWGFLPRWSLVLPTFSGFMILTILAFRYRKDINSRFIPFWISSFIASILLALLHFGSIFLEIPLFARLSPLRATLLLVILSLPLVISYFRRKFIEQNFINCWAAVSLTILLAYFQFGFFWGFVLVLLISDLSEGHFDIINNNLQGSLKHYFPILIWVLLIGWIGLWLISSENLNILIPGARIDSRLNLIVIITFSAFLSIVDRYPIIALLSFGLFSILFVVIVEWLNIGPSGYGVDQIVYLLVGCSLIILGFILSFKRINQDRQLIPFKLVAAKSRLREYHFRMIVLIALMMVLTIVKAWPTRINTAAPEAKANYDAQLWAKNNTEEDAVFMIFGDNWRTVSQRPIRHLLPGRGYYTYTRSREAKKWTDDLLVFYGLQSMRGKMLHTQFYNHLIAAYYNLNEDKIIQMGKSFGGDYIVRSIDHPLDFTVAYRNDYYVIYNLPKQ